MGPGRPRVYDHRWTFTGVCEKNDYDLFLKICDKKGVDASMIYQEAIKKFITDNRGVLTQDSRITDWGGDPEKGTKPNPHHRIPPAYFTEIPEWVKYVHSLKDVDAIIKGKVQAQKIAKIYEAAFDNLQRSFWRGQRRQGEK